MRKTAQLTFALLLGVFIGVSVQGADAHPDGECPPIPEPVSCECPEIVVCAHGAIQMSSEQVEAVDAVQLAYEALQALDAAKSKVEAGPPGPER
tara:strand:+ start:109 stop:390 length:282 start_codon:yes stop_codon:yes gene_type:complete